MTEVICDWLSVTYPTDLHPIESVELLLNSVGFDLRKTALSDSGKKEIWFAPARGNISVRIAKGFVQISASGGALSYLRDCHSYNAYLTCLSAVPYRITRLDAAYDLHVDAAPVVESLIQRYRKSIRLTRENLVTNWILSSRYDDVVSGTFYAGKKNKGGTTGRVYDKQKQLFDVHGEVTGPCVRFEITAQRSMKATLKDAHSPASLFWHVASPALLISPVDVEPWHPSDPDDIGWTTDMPEILPYRTLKRRTEESPDLGALIRLADHCGPHGRAQLIRQLIRRVETETDSTVAVTTTTETEEEGAATG